MHWFSNLATRYLYLTPKLANSESDAGSVHSAHQDILLRFSKENKPNVFTHICGFDSEKQIEMEISWEIPLYQIGWEYFPVIYNTNIFNQNSVFLISHTVLATVCCERSDRLKGTKEASDPKLIIKIDQQSTLFLLLSWPTFPLRGKWGDFVHWRKFLQSINYF